ncbi:unnamed protein product [Dovyalis caffra]|uniref:Signal peptidase complex subunit 1 n=1 Tax=Dovyalis caffra TaxID=77055 RepID=A0AAV1R3I3_9ROSI|nr:unnamed protein product [Dovyalis caffra]
MKKNERNGLDPKNQSCFRHNHLFRFRDLLTSSMDWQGQKQAELWMQILLLVFAVVAFATGYIMGSFRLMMLIYASGVIFTTLVTVPNWPFFNRHPLKWLDPSEAEKHPKPQKVVVSKDKKKSSKKKEAPSWNIKGQLFKESIPTLGFHLYVQDLTLSGSPSLLRDFVSTSKTLLLLKSLSLHPRQQQRRKSKQLCWMDMVYDLRPSDLLASPFGKKDSCYGGACAAVEVLRGVSIKEEKRMRSKVEAKARGQKISTKRQLEGPKLGRQLLPDAPQFLTQTNSIHEPSAPPPVGPPVMKDDVDLCKEANKILYIRQLRETTTKEEVLVWNQTGQNTGNP